MKFNSKHIVSLLYLISNSIIKSKADVVITDEQLNSFSFGAPQFKMAIIGDSGTEKEAKRVMELTSFDALLHLGDYEYKCETDKYFKEILDYDRKYQFMGILGNHEGVSECGKDKSDRFVRNVYNEMMSTSKNSKVQCEFSSSRWMWSCKYKNMRVIGLSNSLSGADDRKDQLAFLKKHLSAATEDWKICAWHYYDDYYHTGKYQYHKNHISDNGESFYDYCKDHGAIIFSAHDHVYARTHVMSKFGTPVIDEYDGKTGGDIAEIRNGATINILNGAGGYEMYIEQGKYKDYDHWQITYARGSHGENANRYGGLFCNFNVGGNNRKAYCEFLRINSSKKLYDSFTIYRNDDPANLSYADIDNNFKVEKINAYKAQNNIVEPVIDGTSNSTDAKPFNSVAGGGVSDEGVEEESSGGAKSYAKIILITGSVLALVGLGLIAYRRKRNSIINEKKEDDYLKDISTKNDDNPYNMMPFPDPYNKKFEDTTEKEKDEEAIETHNIKRGTIDETFKPLSIADQSGFYLNPGNFNFYNDKASSTLGNSDAGSFKDNVPLVNNKTKSVTSTAAAATAAAVSVTAPKTEEENTDNTTTGMNNNHSNSYQYGTGSNPLSVQTQEYTNKSHISQYNNKSPKSPYNEQPSKMRKNSNATKSSVSGYSEQPSSSRMRSNSTATKSSVSGYNEQPSRVRSNSNAAKSPANNYNTSYSRSPAGSYNNASYLKSPGISNTSYSRSPNRYNSSSYLKSPAGSYSKSPSYHNSSSYLKSPASSYSKSPGSYNSSYLKTPGAYSKSPNQYGSSFPN